MTQKRQQQISSAQRGFRARKREAGDHRLQTWLSANAADQLQTLCAELSLGQAAVIEMAIAKLQDEQHTHGKGDL
jgi:hypothetical protein